MKKAPWHQRLVTQAMALQLAVIAGVLLMVSVAFATSERAALEEQYGLRAQAVAESVAEIPDVRRLVDDPTISSELQRVAEAVRLRTGVDFVVITDINGVRHSHPKPERIGLPVSTDPGRALAGISDWYVQTGTLGPSVRGKVPIWDETGENVVGIVSVGVLTGEISATLRERIAGLALAAGAAFATGAVAAFVGARRIRRQTLGLEPPQIAALYEHRDGLLRALHEGVLAVDREGYVSLVNDVAASMLDLQPNTTSQRLDDRPDLLPLIELAEHATSQVDVPIQVDSQTLLVTTAPITIRNKHEGAVFTFRDRTELQGLVSELESAQGLVEALRAQAHEHSNNLHTISGLLELGRTDDVLSIIDDHSSAQRELADLYGYRTGGDSMLVATLLAKAAVAGERDIRLRTHIGELPQIEMKASRDLVTILGNLVDNAVDHLSETTIAGGEVEIGIWHTADAIRIDVSDSGNGVQADDLDMIFQSGFTTKDTRSHDGLGLAIVAELVNHYDGTIRVDSEPGAGTLFSVSLPTPVARKLAHV